jgi:phage recombination protein Bet
MMVLAYCKQRKLDPFKRPVNIVPVWDSKAENGQGGYVDTVWPSISEMRTTAARTGQYAGCDETEFGPMVTRTFTGSVKKRGSWESKTVDVTFPEWAQVVVYRTLGGMRCRFAGPKTYWLETYARLGNSELPNGMWIKRPRGQLEKCAEAGALRKAFPEEIGNDYAAEEMEGQRLDKIEHDDIVVPQKLKAPPPPEAEVIDADGVIEEVAAPAKETVKTTTPIKGKAPPPPPPPAASYDGLMKELQKLNSTEAIVVFQQKHAAAIMALSADGRETLIAAIQKRRGEIEDTFPGDR